MLECLQGGTQRQHRSYEPTARLWLAGQQAGHTTWDLGGVRQRPTGYLSLLVLLLPVVTVVVSEGEREGKGRGKAGRGRHLDSRSPGHKPKSPGPKPGIQGHVDHSDSALNCGGGGGEGGRWWACEAGACSVVVGSACESLQSIGDILAVVR